VPGGGVCRAAGGQISVYRADRRRQRIYDPHYLSGGRSDRFVLFHIFAGKPRRRAQKQGLYRRLCARLADEMAVSPQDVMV
jgi:hypothetical protein